MTMKHILVTASTPTLPSPKLRVLTGPSAASFHSAASTPQGPCLYASLMGWEGEQRHSVAISAFKINDGTEALQKGHRVSRAKKNIVRGAWATDRSRLGYGS